MGRLTAILQKVLIWREESEAIFKSHYFHRCLRMSPIS